MNDSISSDSCVDLSLLKQGDITRIEPLWEVHRGKSLTWNVGRRCNYRCTYCDKDLHDSGSPHRTFGELVEFWTKFKETALSPSDTVEICFTGGEPTLNPDFAGFLHFLRTFEGNRIRSIGLTTNGSESLEYYLGIIQSVDWITFSTHFEWWNEQGFLNMLLDLWRKTGKNQQGKFISVNVMYETAHSKTVQELHSILKTEKIPQTAYKFFNLYGSKGLKNPGSKSFDYKLYLSSRGEAVIENSKPAASSKADLDSLLLREQKEPDIPDVSVTLSDGRIAKTNAFQLANCGLTNFPGWTCNVGNSFYIHNDNAIWAGLCRFKRLGTIDSSFVPLECPVTCDGRLCHCVTDIRQHKFNAMPGNVCMVRPEFRREAIDKKPKKNLSLRE